MLSFKSIWGKIKKVCKDIKNFRKRGSLVNLKGKYDKKFKDGLNDLLLGCESLSFKCIYDKGEVEKAFYNCFDAISGIVQGCLARKAMGWEEDSTANKLIDSMNLPPDMYLKSDNEEQREGKVALGQRAGFRRNGYDLVQYLRAISKAENPKSSSVITKDVKALAEKCVKKVMRIAEADAFEGNQDFEPTVMGKAAACCHDSAIRGFNECLPKVLRRVSTELESGALKLDEVKGVSSELDKLGKWEIEKSKLDSELKLLRNKGELVERMSSFVKGKFADKIEQCGKEACLKNYKEYCGSSMLDYACNITLYWVISKLSYALSPDFKKGGKCFDEMSIADLCTERIGEKAFDVVKTWFPDECSDYLAEAFISDKKVGEVNSSFGYLDKVLDENRGEFAKGAKKLFGVENIQIGISSKEKEKKDLEEYIKRLNESVQDSMKRLLCGKNGDNTFFDELSKAVDGNIILSEMFYRLAIPMTIKTFEALGPLKKVPTGIGRKIAFSLTEGKKERNELCEAMNRILALKENKSIHASADEIKEGVFNCSGLAFISTIESISSCISDGKNITDQIATNKTDVYSVIKDKSGGLKDGESLFEFLKEISSSTCSEGTIYDKKSKAIVEKILSCIPLDGK